MPGGGTFSGRCGPSSESRCSTNCRCSSSRSSSSPVACWRRSWGEMLAAAVSQIPMRGVRRRTGGGLPTRWRGRPAGPGDPRPSTRTGHEGVDADQAGQTRPVVPLPEGHPVGQGHAVTGPERTGHREGRAPHEHRSHGLRGGGPTSEAAADRPAGPSMPPARSRGTQNWPRPAGSPCSASARSGSDSHPGSGWAGPSQVPPSRLRQPVIVEPDGPTLPVVGIVLRSVEPVVEDRDRRIRAARALR